MSATNFDQARENNRRAQQMLDENHAAKKRAATRDPQKDKFAENGRGPLPPANAFDHASTGRTT